MNRMGIVFQFARGFGLGLYACLCILGAPVAEAWIPIVHRDTTAQYPTIVAADARTGKPIPGAIVLVFPDKHCPEPCKPIVTFTANEQGLVRLPRLPFGDYSVIVRTSDGKRDETWIRINRWRVGHGKRIAMSAQLTTLHDVTKIDLQRMQAMTPINVLSFQGVVSAACNGYAPAAVVRVFADGNDPKNILASLQTDLEGRFAAALPAGGYLVRIDSDLCRPLIARVSVSTRYTKEALRFSLEPQIVFE
jgi:hypothetical protein